ncbi:Zinc finger BED domain-containing protein 4 [Mycena kentingensis (nom. inval.)]|nr:Zinc finger BED domain-containing protein 4 [Mycena kentingensis (nom. inval.)]
MIFGVFANPLLRNRLFNRAVLPPISFLHMGRRLMRRFYGKDMQGDMEFQGAIQDMLDNVGFFSDAAFGLDGYRTSGNFDPSFVPDIIRLYRYMAVDLTRLVGRDAYIALAIRVLSILVNSAGPERVFSEFGVVQTKHRNRLNPQKVHKTALVRQDLHRGHVAAGRIPERKARHYSLDGCEVPDGPDSDDAPDPYGEDEESAGEEEDDAEMRDEPFNLFADPFLDGARPEILMDNFFAHASGVLIALADEETSEEIAATMAATGGDGDCSDEDELAEPTLANAAASATRRRPPVPATSIPTSAISRQLPKFKKIPLADLFSYPAPGTANTDLDFYWNVGRVALDKDDVELESQQQERGNTRTAPTAAPLGP